MRGFLRGREREGYIRNFQKARPTLTTTGAFSPSKLSPWQYLLAWKEENELPLRRGDERGVVHGVASSAAWDVVLVLRVDVKEVRSRVVEAGWERLSSWGLREGDEVKLGEDCEEAERESHWEIRDRVDGGSVGLDFKRLSRLGCRSFWVKDAEVVDREELWWCWACSYWGWSSTGLSWLEMGESVGNFLSSPCFSSSIVSYSGKCLSIFSLSSRCVRSRRLCSLALRYNV